MRCLKRYVVREVYRALMQALARQRAQVTHRTRNQLTDAA